MPRIFSVAMPVVAALVGFSALLLGRYSRFGLWKQIIWGIVLIILIKLLDNTMLDASSRDPRAWPLVYVSSLVGLALSVGMLWAAANPQIFNGLRNRRAA